MFNGHREAYSSHLMPSITCDFPVGFIDESAAGIASAAALIAAPAFDGVMICASFDRPAGR